MGDVIWAVVYSDEDGEEWKWLGLDEEAAIAFVGADAAERGNEAHAYYTELRMYEDGHPLTRCAPLAVLRPIVIDPEDGEPYVATLDDLVERPNDILWAPAAIEGVRSE